MAQAGSGNKVANSLVSASCAAVLAVYIAGYTRTQHAANRFAAQIAERRPIVPEASPSSPPLALGERVPEKQEQEREPEHDAAKHKVAPAPTPPVKADLPDPAPLSTPKEALPPLVATAAPIPTPEPTPASEPVVAPVEHKAEPVPTPTPVPSWKDGTYTGWGYSRHGNIEAEVVIEGGRIASALISQCRTRYSCSVIDRLPPQVAQRQSPDVDYVSGATQSADAFYGAVVAALAKAK
jgi:uncharacterized protein with FMN-binding domain